MRRLSPSSRPGRRRSARSRARRGFSLIEILVVIGLIAFLTAAIVAVIPRVANAAKVAATKATIKKVDEMLNDRINGFRRWIQKQDLLAGPGNPPAYVSYSPYVAYWSQSNPSNQPLLKILATKWVFQASFPQAFADMKPPFNTPVNPSSSHKAVTESSECLYQFLTQGPLFDTEPPSAADLRAIETADTDGDGLPEIVDAWGNPLRFYRCPTRLVRPAAWSSSNSTSPPSLASPGPLDEIPQQPIPSPPPSVVVPPSPLSLAMIGAAPRPTLSVWAKSTPYTVGQQVVSGQNPGTVYSVVYQCVVAGTSAGSGTFGTPVPAVGTNVTDNTVQWQVLLDPLSVDPDDPYGIAAGPGAISESSSGTAPFFYPQTPNTWSVPLVVSCGTDGQLGLYEPYDVANFGNLAQPQLCPLNTSGQLTDPSGFNRDPMTDNITNHQQ